jgi:hypothetical protein
MEQLMKCYELRDMGKLSWFLGIRVIRDCTQKKIWLCQDSYIWKIATSFHLDDRWPVFTPITTDALQLHDGQVLPQDIYAY